MPDILVANDLIIVQNRTTQPLNVLELAALVPIVVRTPALARVESGAWGTDPPAAAGRRRDRQETTDEFVGA